MRKICAISLLLVMGIVLSAQNNQQVFNQALQRLGLSSEEIELAVQIEQDANRTKREAGLELNLLKAQLEKELFQTDVDMQQVEKLLRTSLEWKMKAELAEIARRVELRKLLGEDRWEKLLLALKNRRAQLDAEQRQNQAAPQAGRQ